MYKKWKEVDDDMKWQAYRLRIDGLNQTLELWQEAGEELKDSDRQRRSAVYCPLHFCACSVTALQRKRSTDTAGFVPLRALVLSFVLLNKGPASTPRRSSTRKIVSLFRL